MRLIAQKASSCALLLTVILLFAMDALMRF
jgi:hypothetical protein